MGEENCIELNVLGIVVTCITLCGLVHLVFVDAERVVETGDDKGTPGRRCKADVVVKAVPVEKKLLF